MGKMGRCRCRIVEMDAVFAGNATQDGINGADYVIKNTGHTGLLHR